RRDPARQKQSQRHAHLWARCPRIARAQLHENHLSGSRSPMTLARIKKGDDVIVLAGRERGKRGIVRQVNPSQGTALVQDINISKRHMKPTGTARQAGIVDKEQPIQLSNLALVDPKTSKPTRMRVRELTGGKKVRIATASGEQMARE